MPWEKSFDESEVIKRAMGVFWEKGYRATSISDITEATGIKRGSLYNAFEGKHDIFLRGLQHYDAGHRCKILELLERVDKPLDAIATLFDFVVNDTLADTDRKGCLLVNTALEYPSHEADIQELVSNGLHDVVGFLEKQIKRGQKLNSIGMSVKPRATARALFASLVGIRVLGRGVFEELQLRQVAEEAQKLLDVA